MPVTSSYKERLQRAHFSKYYHWEEHRTGGPAPTTELSSTETTPTAGRRIRAERQTALGATRPVTAPPRGSAAVRDLHQQWRRGRWRLETSHLEEPTAGCERSSVSNIPAPVLDWTDEELDVSSLTAGSSQRLTSSFVTLGDHFKAPLTSCSEPLPPEGVQASIRPSLLLEVTGTSSLHMGDRSDGMVHSVRPTPAMGHHPHRYCVLPETEAVPPDGLSHTPVTRQETTHTPSGPRLHDCASAPKVRAPLPKAMPNPSLLPQSPSPESLPSKRYTGPMHGFFAASDTPRREWRPDRADGMPRALHAMDALIEQLSYEITRLFRSEGGGVSEVQVAEGCRERGLEYLDDQFLPVLRHIIGDTVRELDDEFADESGSDREAKHWRELTRDERGMDEAVQLCRLLEKELHEKALDTHYQRRDCSRAQRTILQLLPSSALVSLPARQLVRLLFPAVDSEPESASPLLLPLGDRSVRPDGWHTGRLLRNREAIAGLAALAEAGRAVRSIFSSNTAATERSGLFVLWVCPFGLWELLSIDSHLPCMVSNAEASGQKHCELLGCSVGRSMWAPACEKALAKLCGSYAETGCLTAPRCVSVFTGGPVERWSWWHRDAPTALREMETVLTSTSRGAGMVLMRTRRAPCAALDRLCRGTTYRLLAVDAPPGRHAAPQLLLRVWHTDATGLYQEEHRKASRASSSCVWLDYPTVQRCFDSCHVCFDCRLFHDVRVPLTFRRFTASGPFVPFFLLRVRVLPAEHEGAVSRAAQLWIGLHQPQPLDPSARPGESTGSSFVQCRYGLKLTLMSVSEDASLLPSAALCRPPYSVLAESYSGEYQQLPAVWMHLELDRPSATASQSSLEDRAEFFVVAHVVETKERRRKQGAATDFLDGDDQRSAAFVRWQRETLNEKTPLPPASSSPVECAGVVSLLTPTYEALAVSVLASPAELPAALLHSQLERVDFEQSAELPPHGRNGEGLHVQVNGRWEDGWHW